jgi:hypothetical protein
MLTQLAAASPAIAIACGTVIALLILCAATVATMAVRAAEPKDVPKVVATICRALRRR